MRAAILKLICLYNLSCFNVLNIAASNQPFNAPRLTWWPYLCSPCEVELEKVAGGRLSGWPGGVELLNSSNQKWCSDFGETYERGKGGIFTLS